MTNITAAIIITVTTNWTSIGEFKDKAGFTFDVQQGKLSTNHIVIFEDAGKKVEYIFKSFEGPVVDERKDKKNVIVFYNNNWNLGTNSYLTNLLGGVWYTN